MTPNISHISVPTAKPVDPDTEKQHSHMDSTPVISQTSTPTRSRLRLFYPLLSLLFLGLLSVSAYVTIEPSIMNPYDYQYDQQHGILNLLQPTHHLPSNTFYVFDNLISQNKSMSTQKVFHNGTQCQQKYSWDTG